MGDSEERRRFSPLDWNLVRNPAWTHANEKPCSVSEGTPPYLSPERPVAVVLGQEGKGVCPQPSILAWRSPMKGTHT